MNVATHSHILNVQLVFNCPSQAENLYVQHVLAQYDIHTPLNSDGKQRTNNIVIISRRAHSFSSKVQ